MTISLRRDTRPESGSMMPARIFRRVDLPEPLFPIKPIRFPSWMVNDASCNTTCSPKRAESSCPVTMTGLIVFDTGRSGGFLCVEQYPGATAPGGGGLGMY